MADSKAIEVDMLASDEFNNEKPSSIEVQIIEEVMTAKPRSMDLPVYDDISNVEQGYSALTISREQDFHNTISYMPNSIEVSASEDITNEKPILTEIPLDLSEQEYVNAAFEFGDDGPSGGKFVEIVDQILKQPSDSDLHPYGRGNLYASIFKSRELHDPTDGGKLISWFVVVILLVGIAGGIVMLAITWEAEQLVLEKAHAINSSMAFR